MSSQFQPVPPLELRNLMEYGLHHGCKQSWIATHWLRLGVMPIPDLGVIESLDDAIVVGLDAEWYEYDSNHITELGVSILDPRFIKSWNSPWEVLKAMVTHHVRIKPNAHMINSQLCHGYPEEFQFGKTTFVDVAEAKNMLRHSFIRFDTRGRPRPVIFVGHAVDNDAKMIKERFGLDIEGLGVIVATIDTQVLAVEVGLVAAGRKIRLCDLLGKFDIAEKYLHNAGNDIVCTMVVALLMLFPDLADSVEYGDTYVSKPGTTGYGCLPSCLLQLEAATPGKEQVDLRINNVLYEMRIE